jgi:hypothetical protein
VDWLLQYVARPVGLEVWAKHRVCFVVEPGSARNADLHWMVQRKVGLLGKREDNTGLGTVVERVEQPGEEEWEREWGSVPSGGGGVKSVMGCGSVDW